METVTNPSVNRQILEERTSFEFVEFMSTVDLSENLDHVLLYERFLKANPNLKEIYYNARRFKADLSFYRKFVTADPQQNEKWFKESVEVAKQGHRESFLIAQISRIDQRLKGANLSRMSQQVELLIMRDYLVELLETVNKKINGEEKV